MSEDGRKHKHYQVLNLIGYGLSKFNMDFIHEYGFKTKISFYEYIVSIGIAETTGTVKNRQDLFDGMIDGGQRKGWWQKGAVYKHRKDFIDSQFGDLDVFEYIDIVKVAIEEDLGKIISVDKDTVLASPILRSRYKQIQETGRESEYYFINNFKKIPEFKTAEISDARLFGDGYDFQLKSGSNYFLAEIKGLKAKQGNVRLTENEYNKALEYKERYALIVVSDIINVPKMVSVFNPLKCIAFEKKIIESQQVYFNSSNRLW